MGEYVRLEQMLPRTTALFSRRLFLSLRLTTRIAESVLAVSLGGAHAWSLVLLGAGCAMFDIGLAAVLDRGRRGHGPQVGMLPRLGLDVVDVAL